MIRLHWFMAMVAAIWHLSSQPLVAADLPAFVAGPLSGLIFDCRQAGQNAPKPEAYVTRADFDGDGKPDFAVDAGKGCKANRDLYCNAEGCTIDVYLSSSAAAEGAFRAQSLRVVERGGRKALSVTTSGAGCAGSPAGTCTITRIFDGKNFIVVP